MFAMKGRGRTDSEGSAYRPQWSKDGEGFVSGTSGGSLPVKDATATGSGQGDEHRGDRRKAKVLRYTKEELLALHSPRTEAPQLSPEITVIAEYSLPPVSTLPFDYEEIYKQWSLNRNRGRGRGRGNALPGAPPNLRGHVEREARGDDGDGVKGQRDDSHRHEERDAMWERGVKITEGSRGDDAWDDVLEQGGSNDMDLSSMAEAAEKFRREMDAMREELQGSKTNTNEIQDDLDAFDKKLEDAAATGQFDDSDHEDGQWDDPAPEVDQMDASSTKQSVDHLVVTPLGREVNDSRVVDGVGFIDNRIGLESKEELLVPSDGGLAGLSSLRLEVVDEWFYLDPQGLQQGPFKSVEMREWYEAGYFKPHLPIRFGREGVFTALASQFAAGQVPFAAPLPPLNDLGEMSAASRQRDQQRLLEMQRDQQRQQQQQQQQMIQLQLQLQQQQHQQQQRMMQLDQEEKMRLELQRLEVARQQQQTQLFQQQQMLRHQQEQQRQQQLQQQQQQMLLQHQNSWQSSQREGIMSALGLFEERSKGSFRVNDDFGSNGVTSYQSNFSLQHELNLQKTTQSVSQNAVLHNNEAQRRDQAFWPTQGSTIANIGNASDRPGGLQIMQPSSPVMPEPLQQSTPRSPATEPVADAWRTGPKSSERSSSTLSSVQNEEKRSAGEINRRSSDRGNSQQDKLKVASSTKECKSSERSEKKADLSMSRNNGKSPKAETNAWASGSVSATALTTSKSLKDIQEEEQRELLNKMSSDDSEDKSLAQMGVQLKMMLGVNSVTMNRSSSGSVALSPSRSSAASAPTSGTPVASAWGTPAAVTKSSNSKSMRDILAEEERLAQERAKANENAPTSSHWMNVVAGNKVAAALIPKPTRSVLGPVPASVLKSRQQVRAVNGAAPPAVAKTESDASFWNFKAARSSDSEPLSTNAPTDASNAFGKKKVSSEFMGWAFKQLQTIDSNANGALLEYLASVEDPGEIREYLAAYLGSTPQVSAFATEFIQRKKTQSNSNKSPGQQDAQQRAFETGSSNKRGKRRLKSHKVDPSLLNYSVGS